MLVRLTNIKRNGTVVSDIYAGNQYCCNPVSETFIAGKLLLKDGQYSPSHFRRFKTGNVINRGGVLACNDRIFIEV